MEPLLSILAGIDFTPTSHLVLEKAIRLARANGAKLTVLHVVDDDRFERSRVPRREGLPAPGVEEILRPAQDRMAELLAQHDLSGLAPSIEVLLGNPYKVILDLVETQAIGLVALSAHDAQERRLGPVASRCVRRVPADILLVRDWHAQPYQRIAACVDFSETSRRALAYAIRLARQDEARLELLHAIYPPGRDYAGQALYQRMDDRLTYEQEVQQEVEKTIEQFIEPFGAELAGIDFHTTILHATHVALEITSHLKRENCDLVALGTTGKSRMLGTLLGSNAERLIHDAPCSVLAVKSARG
ncbi:MAG TPA: universal stress protein [Verrucomicrobiales bacterium]|nr:universal stress protein [Verrucomicrobiales bacterium]